MVGRGSLQMVGRGSGIAEKASQRRNAISSVYGSPPESCRAAGSTTHGSAALRRFVLGLSAGPSPERDRVLAICSLAKPRMSPDPRRKNISGRLAGPRSARGRAPSPICTSPYQLVGVSPISPAVRLGNAAKSFCTNERLSRTAAGPERTAHCPRPAQERWRDLLPSG